MHDEGSAFEKDLKGGGQDVANRALPHYHLET